MRVAGRGTALETRCDEVDEPVRVADSLSYQAMHLDERARSTIVSPASTIDE